MTIARVECLVLAAEYPVVRVETTDGLVGWGECFRRAAALVKPAIEQFFAPLLVGQDARNIAQLHRRLKTSAEVFGPPGALAVAIAGVDIALWDLLGKTLGQPIWRLLGGQVRDRVPVYASSLRRDLTPAQEAERVARFAALGYRAYKLHGAVPGRVDDPADHTVETVRAIRALVGDEIKLLVDVNGAYSVHHAIEIGRRLQQLGVGVFECPVPERQHDALARVADALDIAVAAGEYHYTADGFRALIENGRIDIVQPDVVKAGGITELQEIAALATAHHRPIMVHNTQPTICTAAHLQFCAAQPLMPYEHEYNIEPVSIRDTWPILPGQLCVDNGYLTVPDGPGLGIEVDEPLVRRLAAVTDVSPGL